MAFWNKKNKEEMQSHPHTHSHSHPSPAASPSTGARFFDIKQRPSALAHVKHVIAIASGKGGVGKSTVSTNLAMALKELKASVGLMDADIYGPSQPGMLGAANKKVEMPDGHLRPVLSHGIPFISMGSVMSDEGPVVWRAPMAMKMIHQFITNVEWGELDYLLVDLPPGTGDVQLSLAQGAPLTGAIIVTTPQQVALGIAKKGLRMFQQVNVPILGIIENMSGFTCGKCGEVTPIFKEGGGAELARELKVPFLGAIPLDPAIMESSDAGRPITQDSRSPSAKAFFNVANLFMRSLEATTGAESTEPREVGVSPSGELLIHWPDDHRGKHLPFSLRVHCGCAHCKDENSGKKILDDSQVPLDIQIKSFAVQGRYALLIGFSDNHNTGIYTYRKLREICECDECGKKDDRESFEV